MPYETITNDNIWAKYTTGVYTGGTGDILIEYCTDPYITAIAGSIYTIDPGTTGVINSIYQGSLISGGIYGSSPFVPPIELSPEELKKQAQKSRLKSNLIIQIKTRAELPQTLPDNEKIAMESLREVLSETEFRKYLKYGFILVKGQGGDTYQIFRNRSHTKVWRGGKVIEEICVRIKYETGVPPTDNVIAFRAIIQTNENAFKKLGNVYKMNGNTRVGLGGYVEGQVGQAGITQGILAAAA
jgi:hypothetical protein